MTTTNDKIRSVLLTAMCVMSVFAGVTAFTGSATAATNDEVTASFLQSTNDEATASFDQRAVSDQRGDVIEIPISFENTDTAQVTIGSDDVNFIATVEVADGSGENDDGNATIVVNTAMSPSSGNLISVKNGELTGDGVTYEQGGSYGQPLDVGNYNLSIAVDRGSGYEEVDVGSLVITERSTDSAQSWIAPQSAINGNTTASGLLDTVTQRDTVAQGDYVVVQVEASGLYGDLNKSQLDKSVNSDGLQLVFTEANPGMNQNADTFTGSDDGVSILQDPENNTFFALVDTSSVSGSALDTGSWNATFTVTPEFHNLVDENESVSTTFTVEEPSAEINGGNDVTVPQGQANISGTTNLAPGTELTVQARAGGRFLKTSTVEVGQDGNFTAPFDFSDASNGTEFTVSLRDTGGVTVDYDEIGGVVSTNAQTTTGTATTGTATTGTATATATETATPTETTTTTTTTTTPGETTTTNTGGDGGVPGFGVSISLVALIAAALLALRRSN